MSEILTCFVSEIVIVRHPFSVCVPVSHKVTLSVRAEGTGILNYQWFTDDEKEVCGFYCAFEYYENYELQKTVK